MLPAELPGWDACSIQTSLQMLLGTGALKLYFLPSIFVSFYCIQNILQKVHGLDGSRVRWDIVIPNFSFNLPYLQKPSSKALNIIRDLVYTLCFSLWPSFTVPCTTIFLFLLSSLEHQLKCRRPRRAAEQRCGLAVPGLKEKKKLLMSYFPGRCYSLGTARKVVMLQRAGSD